jgi:hypothetical protein
MVSEEVQGASDPGFCLFGIDPVTVCADAQGCQTKARSRYAADVAAFLRVSSAGGSISREAGMGIRLFPKKAKRALAHAVEK